MGLCLQCKKWVNQTKGKRKKLFCNDTCRSNYRYAKNKKSKVVYKPPQKEYDSPKLPDNFTKDEPLSFSGLRQEMAEKGSYAQFFEDLNAAQDLEQLERIGKRIRSSGLSWKEKERLKEAGQQIMKNKFID